MKLTFHFQFSKFQYATHCSKSLSLSKNSTLIFREKLSIFWVKNLWKCWGFVKIEFLDKNLTFRIVWEANNRCLWHTKNKTFFSLSFFIYDLFIYIPPVCNPLFSTWQSLKITQKSLNDTYIHTVFENQRRCLIQHCERGELRLHFVDKS